MSGRAVFHPEEGTESAHGVEQVHVSRGVVGKNGVRIKVRRPHPEHAVRPGGKAGGIVVKAMGKTRTGQAQGEGKAKEQDGRGRAGISFPVSAQETGSEQGQSKECGKVYV